MQQIDVSTLEQLETLIQDNLAVLVYFSTPECGVCKVIKPQILEMLSQKYPQVRFAYVDVAQCPEVAAQSSVLSVPTLSIYFDGRESQQFVRNFSLSQVDGAISRPYEMLF